MIPDRPSPSLPRGLSLERRLPLLITALLAMVLAVGVFVAHAEVKRTATVAARERLRLATQQLATLAAASVPPRQLVIHAVAQDPAIPAALASDDPGVRAAAEAALRRLERRLEPETPIALWDVDGRIHARIGTFPDSAAARSGILPGRRPQGPGVSHLFRMGGQSFYWVASPVTRGADTLGFVGEMRRVGGPTATPLEALIGPGVELFFANSDDTTWVTLEGGPAPAPRGWPFQGASVYTSADGEGHFAHAVPLPGLPWSIVGAQAHSVVMARPDGFLRHGLMLGLGLCVVGAAGAWLVSRSITRPLRALGMASEAIAQGDYARRIGSRRADELGILADRFDRMAAQVQVTHDELREQYETAQSLAEELEHTNEQLESALAEADAARDEAEAANRSKSDFLATMSHEIRTPINAIIGYTELISMELEGPLTPGQRAQLARVEFSSRHLTGLVDQLLDFARIEAGSLRVERRAASAAEAIAAAATVLGPEAAAKGVAIDTDCGADLRYEGDPQRVDQILLNLLSNAIKFTAAGGRAELRCTLLATTLPTTGTDGRWVCIRVSDTGIGIPPEQMERIFEPFVQVESGYTRRHGGAGLGLAISRRFAQWMGGDLTVESAPGAGSAFTLWLPAT